MKKINPEYVERVNRLVNRSPFFSLISMEIIEIGPCYSFLEIKIDNKHLQPFGNVHGGVFAAIIDAAAFWAVFYQIQDPAVGMTSIDLKLNFLAPASSGKLVAKGRQIRLGKTLGYAEVEVSSQTGEMVAHGTSTLMILPGMPLKDNPPLPTKFIEGEI